MNRRHLHPGDPRVGLTIAPFCRIRMPPLSTRITSGVPRLSSFGIKSLAFRLVCPFLALSGLLQAESPASAQARSAWPKLGEVIVVSKTHFDIGYTDLASRVVDRYRTSMADQALKLVDESLGLPPDQQFSWTLAGWPMAQILWPGQTPDRRDRFLAAMRQGRLVPHAMAFTTHTESLDLEDLTRGLRYSVEMARLAGRPLPTAAKMTDVTSHAAVTATILARGGDILPSGLQRGLFPPRSPAAVLVGGTRRVARVDCAFRGVRHGPLPAADWPHKTWLCMWMTGDNHGPPNAQEVQRLFARAKQDLPDVRVRFGQMSDFAEAILREKPELPVVRGDMPDTWIHGIGSMPIKPSSPTPHGHGSRLGGARHTLERLGRAGCVRRRCRSRGLREYPVVRRTHLGARRSSLCRLQLRRGVAEEAGRRRLSLPPGGIRPETRYARKAAALVDPAIAQRMAALAEAVNVSGRRIVVFDPLPWSRDDAVDVPWTEAACA